MLNKTYCNLIFIWFIILIPAVIVSGQVTFNPRSPINHPILLSGSFGELRATHFHAGIDIKSKNGKTGDPVYSIEEGYVSRIVVRADGYGNAIYVSHPGSYTSVYGHFEEFASPFAEFVKQTQYKNKSFEIEISPEPEQFPVTKGQLLGKMGNTGTSFGPHLHFEVRNSKTDRPLNPFFYGFRPPDKRPPVISGIKLTQFTFDSIEFKSQQFPATNLGNGKFKLKSDTLITDNELVGIEFKGYDQMDGVYNKHGIVELTMKLNGKTVYQYRVDSFTFEEAQHIYAHVNYTSFFQDKSQYQHCYILPADPLKIYLNKGSTGSLITMKPGEKHLIEILAKDFNHNESKIRFWVKRLDKPNAKPFPLVYNYILDPGKPALINDKSSILYFSDSALYARMYLHLTQSDSTERPYRSPFIFINNGNKIFKEKVDLFIRYDSLPPEKLIKTVVVECGPGNKLTSYGGEIFDTYIHAKINRFGTYALFADTIPPVIKSKNFKPDMSGQASVSFTIEDNLDSENRSNELRYYGYIDEEWVLFEYDKKSKTIMHRFEKSLKKGGHLLKIEVYDGKNNLSVFKAKFIR